MASKDDIIAELRRIVAEQGRRIAELELQLAKALKNSSHFRPANAGHDRRAQVAGTLQLLDDRHLDE